VNDVQVKRQKLAANDVVRFGPFSFKFESRDTLDRTSPIKVGKFLEVLTQVGAELPAKIIDSLDVSMVNNASLAHGLVELEDADRKLRTLYAFMQRSEEHTSELQSPCNLVCRLLLEKKKWWEK